jgi:hypothetical protein
VTFGARQETEELEGFGDVSPSHLVFVTIEKTSSRLHAEVVREYANQSAYGLDGLADLVSRYRAYRRAIHSAGR